LIQPEDKLSPQQVYEYLKSVKGIAEKIKNPLDDIELIFTKIEKWRQSFGNSEEQEKAIAQALKPPPEREIHMHNLKTAMELVLSFNEKLNLSDDEITLITFTSLQLETLNNMIVQTSEFTKWFTIDFRGENREEKDFKEDKFEIWEATVALAAQFVSEFEQLKEDQRIALT